jgi:acetolactate decarboxylase
MKRVILLMMVAGLVSVGCRSARWQAADEFSDTLTHAGTITDLAAGAYGGFIAVSNVLRYGDFGLGTFDGLDGEMVVWSGMVYRAGADMRLAAAAPDATTPFTVVTWFSPDRMFDVERMDRGLFERAMALRRKNERLPQAISVNGRFSLLHIRSVAAQQPPWRPLSDALAADSRDQVLTNATGRMVGFFMPSPFAALHPAGYHFHFMSADGTTGGHVLDFAIAQARIEVDASDRIQVLVNTNAAVTSPR